MSEQTTSPDTDLPMVSDCEEHHYMSLMRGGEPMHVRLCTLCGAIDWDDLRRQVQEREAALVTELARAKRRGDVHRDRVNDESVRAYSQGVEDMRTKVAAGIVADEQKCQEAINANPTNPHLQGRLTGLQRARDIVTDPHGGEEVHPGSIRAAEDALEKYLEEKPTDLASRVDALEADNAHLKDMWNQLVQSVRSAKTKANLAHARGKSNTALISDVVQTLGNLNERLTELEDPEDETGRAGEHSDT